VPSIRRQIHINNPTVGWINAATHDTAATQLRPPRDSTAAGYGSTQPDTGYLFIHLGYYFHSG
jgi:hypothetical protein